MKKIYTTLYSLLFSNAALLRNSLLPAAFLLILLQLSLLAPQVFASSTEDFLPELESGATWNIESDQAESLENGKILEAKGDVILSQGENMLRADFARYHRETHWVHLKGNVKAMLGGDELEAAEAEFDLKNKVGWLKDGKIFLEEPHLYLSGKHVEKEWGEVYTFQEAKVTACDGDDPAWSFDADEGKVTVNGKARLKNARFRIKDTPVLWTPYFSMTTAKRQSGFLVPGVGYSSRLGAEINLPIYFAIDDQNDITLYENLLTARGLMQGIEYRNNWDFIKGKGYWRFDYLYDAIVMGDESKEHSPLDQDGLVRTNHDRYWLRSMFNAEIPGSELQVKLDLDYVSDQNYLRVFQSGKSGYDKSRDTFLEEFHRDIAASDQDRISTLQVSKDWERGLVAVQGQYTQAVDYGHGNESLSKDPTVQRMPELNAYLYKNTLPGLENLPVEIQADLQAVNFWRRYGVTGGRFDFHPSLSVPLVSDYGSIIPSVGYRQTIWNIDQREGNTRDLTSNDTPTRELFDVNVLGETQVWRVFDLDSSALALNESNVGEGRWTKIKHNFIPRVEYNFVPDVSQEHLPKFDVDDRVDDANNLTYSITNVASRKREEVVMLDEGSEVSPRPGLRVDYLDFVRLRVEQSYDFLEADRQYDLDQYDRRPFSDVLADLRFRVDKYISLTNKTWFSPYTSEVTEHDHTLEVGAPEYITTYFGFDFQEEIDEFNRRNRPDISILKAGLDLSLPAGFNIGADYKTDLVEEENLETSISIGYTHQCFDIKIAGTTTPIENRVEAWVSLMGLSFF